MKSSLIKIQNSLQSMKKGKDFTMSV